AGHHPAEGGDTVAKRVLVRHDGDLFPGPEVPRAQLQILPHRASRPTIERFAQDIDNPNRAVSFLLGVDCRCENRFIIRAGNLANRLNRDYTFRRSFDQLQHLTSPLSGNALPAYACYQSRAIAPAIRRSTSTYASSATSKTTLM